MFRKNNRSDELDYKAINRFFYTSNNLLKFVLALVIILAILLATYLIKEWNILGIIGTILSIISPVFIGFVIAWLLDPLATKLATKMPRVVACILTYLIVFGGIIGLLILYTDARLGTYSIFLILFATIFYNFTNRICHNKKNCRGVNNIYWILTFAVPLFFVLAVWATASFQYNDFAWNFMDKLVSNRLTLCHEAMQKYEIPL